MLDSCGVVVGCDYNNNNNNNRVFVKKNLKCAECASVRKREMS